MTYEELEETLGDLQGKFSSVKTDLYSSAYPFNDNEIIETVSAIEEGFENLLLAIGYMQNDETQTDS